MKSLFSFLLLATVPIFGASQYYLSDKLTTRDANRWNMVGVLAHSSIGLITPDARGGAMISRVPIPDSSSDVEVAATIALHASGGVYTEYVQASADAQTSANGSGTFLAFEMHNPTFDEKGHCQANFVILKSVAGSVTLVSSFQHGCRDGMQMRFAIHGNTALAWPDQALPIEFAVTPGMGQPGIGSYGVPDGNAISSVQLGTVNHTAPSAIDQSAIGVSAFRNRVDVQWKAVPEDTDGNLAGYWISRDGQYMMRTSATHFSDEAVHPGESHSYTIKAVDQHFNFSPEVAITVATPSIQASK